MRRMTAPLFACLGFTLLAACGGGGAASEDGGGGPSLLPVGVTVQDLVATEWVERTTGETLLVLADRLGRGQFTVPGVTLTPDGFVDEFEWSPDHTHLAILANRDGIEDTVLLVVDASTGDVVPVSGPQTPDEFVSDFAWSPDGTHLAFDRAGADAETNPVFTVRRDGADLVEVSGPIVAGGAQTSFVWSPDSTRLAMAIDADVVGKTEVFVVERAGTNRVNVSGSGALASTGLNLLTWAPDSSRVAFLGVFDAGASEIFSSRADGVGGRVREHAPLVAGGNVFSFRWAPDASRIAFVGDAVANEVFELRTAVPGSGTSVNLSGALVAGGDVTLTYDWAPDTSRIAFVADKLTNDVFELFTVVPDGTAAPVRVSGPMVAGGDVGGRILSFGELAWSPDSARIAYVADQETDATEEVFVTLAASAASVRVSASVNPGGEVQAPPTWLSDSSRVRWRAPHRSTTIEDFLAPPAGGPVPIVASVAGFAFGLGLDVPEERVLLQVGPNASPTDDVRSYDLDGLDEVVVVVAPADADLDDVVVR